VRIVLACALAGILALMGCSTPPRSSWTDRADAVIEEAISLREIPGAVLWVGRRDHTIYRKAYGMRALQPTPEAMSLDTVFDLASLTKVLATASAVMVLVEDGKIRLSDRVSAVLPEFTGPSKEVVTIRHLLTHTSGLRPSLDLQPGWRGAEEAVRRAAQEDLQAAPGEQFVYSDIGFILLGEIVSRVSGVPLEEFVRRRVWEPLGMEQTEFRPPESLIPRIAPTQSCASQDGPCEGADRSMMRGVVHDPTARRMGGVAGHAGVFAQASDLSRYVRMLLRGGELEGRRVLSASGVARMTSRATPPSMSVQRGLGWDIDSRYSSSRGDLFPIGSFGHTGFTGTSIWIDPFSGVYVILLTHRVHPHGQGDAIPLRSKVATIVAAALAGDSYSEIARGRSFASPEFKSPAPPSAQPPHPPVVIDSDTPETPVPSGLQVQALSPWGRKTNIASQNRGELHALWETA